MGILTAVAQQNQQIDIRVRVQFATPIAADRQQGDVFWISL